MKWLAPLVARSLDALHKRCRATLVPAPEMAPALSARGIPNVEVVGRGVDTTLFNPARRSQALRRAWGLTDSQDGQQLACLYVGRLAPEKNLGLVLKAYAAIVSEHPQARMIWVGDGPARSQLQANHPDHIFAGSRTGFDLAMHYASADLFLFGSLSETWGNVIGEAMASGLAVVTYARAAGGSLIQSGENGCAVPPEDETAFVQSAAALANDAELRSRVASQAARDMASNAWSGVIGTLENVLTRVVNSSQ